MTDKQMWQKFCRETGVPPDTHYESWAFGSEPNKLAKLVLRGEKVATASLKLWYDGGETMPTVGQYNVVLDENDEAVCIIRDTHLYTVPFYQVSAMHAYKEGEGDKSLEYWRRVHRDFFGEELKTEGKEFHDNMEVLCEEFELVYPVPKDPNLH